MHKLDWSNIFNTDHTLYGHISIACDAVKASGYPYYAWNGRIYEVNSGKRMGAYDSEDVITSPISLDMTAEMSSGYAGFRCNKCGKWEYAANVLEHMCHSK